MLKGIGNLANLMKQAQQMGGRMQEMSAKLKSQRASGEAGGGLVRVEVNGLGELISCRIDPQLLAKDDSEMTEDLIVAAANQAIEAARKLHADAMGALSGEMNLPGLEDALSQLTNMTDNPGGSPGA